MNQYEVAQQLKTLNHLLHVKRRLRHEHHGPLFDKSHGQGRVLALLKLKSPVSTKELGYLLGIRQQSLNEQIQKLEKAGYVTRIPSETDRRVLLVELTEAGRNVPQQEEREEESFLDVLDENELNTLSDLLSKLSAPLKEELDGIWQMEPPKPPHPHHHPPHPHEKEPELISSPPSEQ